MLWPCKCHSSILLAAGDQGSGGDHDEDFHTELDRGASGNATQHAAEFVVRQHMRFLSKRTLAQAIMLLYSACEQRPDDAVSKHCAMKQAYGIKRMVWVLDLPPVVSYMFVQCDSRPNTDCPGCVLKLLQIRVYGNLY